MSPDTEIILNRLDRQDDKLDQLHHDVEKLKARASFWGALSGAIFAFLTQLLGGC